MRVNERGEGRGGWGGGRGRGVAVHPHQRADPTTGASVLGAGWASLPLHHQLVQALRLWRSQSAASGPGLHLKLPPPPAGTPTKAKKTGVKSSCHLGTNLFGSPPRAAAVVPWSGQPLPSPLPLLPRLTLYRCLPKRVHLLARERVAPQQQQRRQVGACPRPGTSHPLCGTSCPPLAPAIAPAKTAT
jgi:hypothetical protein